MSVLQLRIARIAAPGASSGPRWHRRSRWRVRALRPMYGARRRQAHRAAPREPQARQIPTRRAVRRQRGGARQFAQRLQASWAGRPSTTAPAASATDGSDCIGHAEANAGDQRAHEERRCGQCDHHRHQQLRTPALACCAGLHLVCRGGAADFALDEVSWAMGLIDELSFAQSAATSRASGGIEYWPRSSYIASHHHLPRGQHRMTDNRLVVKLKPIVRVHCPDRGDPSGRTVPVMCPTGSVVIPWWHDHPRHRRRDLRAGDGRPGGQPGARSAAPATWSSSATRRAALRDHRPSRRFAASKSTTRSPGAQAAAHRACYLAVATSSSAERPDADPSDALPRPIICVFVEMHASDNAAVRAGRVPADQPSRRAHLPRWRRHRSRA